jgi:hypothetical protein
VEVVRRRVERLGLVAARAETVVRERDLARVHVVAVAARHAAAVHLRLQERAVLVDLVQDLSVGVVERGVEEAHVVAVGERTAERVRRAVRTATRVAPRARLDLGTEDTR